MSLQLEVAQIPNLLPITDCKTRWNSTFLMIERALLIRDAVELTIVQEDELKCLALSDQDWGLLIILKDILQLFKEGSDLLCASKYPTLSLAVPIYNTLLRKLEEYAEEHKHTVIGDAIVVAIEKLQEYYCKSKGKAYYAATILDPRLNLHYFKDQEACRVNWASQCISEVYNDYETPTQHVVAIQEPENGNTFSHIFKRRTKMEKRWQSMLSQEDGSVDILEWWSTSGRQFPQLASAARDYLAIPATGAPVERVFSTGADLVKKKRNSLSSDTIRESLCLRSWFKVNS